MEQVWLSLNTYLENAFQQTREKKKGEVTTENEMMGSFGWSKAFPQGDNCAGKHSCLVTKV